MRAGNCWGERVALATMPVGLAAWRMRQAWPGGRVLHALFAYSAYSWAESQA